MSKKTKNPKQQSYEINMFDDEFEYELENEIEDIEDIEDILEEDEEMDSVKNKLLKSQDREYQDSIKSYLTEVSQYQLLTAEEEKELSRRIEQGDQAALHQLINSNLRLVIKIAKAYMSNDYPFIDLIQDGNLGLIRAAEKFDYRKNVRFSTYAARWIKQMIIRALAQKKRHVRLPYRKEKTLRKIKEVSNKFLNEKKRYPSLYEISNELGLKQKEVEDTQFSEISVCSLEEQLTDDHFSLNNIIGDVAYNPDVTLIKKDMEEETHKMLESLYPKERLILIHRFGLEDGEKQTFKEMGNQFGLSAETIRQLEIRTLKKIENNFAYLRTYIAS